MHGKALSTHSAYDPMPPNVSLDLVPTIVWDPFCWETRVTRSYRRPPPTSAPLCPLLPLPGVSLETFLAECKLEMVAYNREKADQDEPPEYRVKRSGRKLLRGFYPLNFSR